MRQKRTAIILICLTLALLTLAAYWPAVHFDFTNYDDPDYVIYNSPIQHGVTAASVAWAFKSNFASNWHPLTWISHMVDYSFYGLNPGGHHLTNLLLHTANSVLLFLLLLKLTGSAWRSAWVAALFAWHPLHVESVAWISERKDVLSAFFWLLAIFAYVFYAGTVMAKAADARMRKLCYALALIFFALGLLAKPMVVTLPFVLLLLDFWPLKRTATSPGSSSVWPKLLLEKTPFLALALIDGRITFWAQKESNSVISAAAFPFLARVANALVSYVLYLWKTIWPTDLAVPYPYSHEWTFWQAGGAAIFLLLISAFVTARRRAHPYLLVGWLWFLITLLPVIGLVQVGIQGMADRYAYLPLIGIFMMAAWSIPGAWAQWPRPGLVFGAVVAGLLIFLLAGMETQLQYWRNSVTLFTHATGVTQNNILAEYNLAEALARQGDEELAVVHYQKALAIKPNRLEAQSNPQLQAHYNLGLIFRAHKKWPEAEAQFRACVSEQPNQAKNHLNLGVALLGCGKKDEALVEFRTAAMLDPLHSDELQFLTEVELACAETGRWPDAISAAQKTREAALAKDRQDLAEAAEKRLASYRAEKF